uniref:Apolipoprotein B n=1 Tax=Latimeria chalumnae TaxID=7897 RepID=H3B136_LATCH
MGNPKLCLLLLLTSCVLAVYLIHFFHAEKNDDSSENQSTCSKDTTRFKHLKKYIYSYAAETYNGVAGTADAQSSAKISCKVELEVPQPCSFILRVNQCTLREVTAISADGKAVFKKTKNSDDFSTSISKYELKFTVSDGNKVSLYPDQKDPTNILNIKRGIISALMVPAKTKEDVQTVTTDTVYGQCPTEMTVSDRKQESTAIKITINRDLSACDQFVPIREYVSPLALIKGLNTPLSTLIRSKQSCDYVLDPRRKHVSEATCIEKHIFLPFSHKNQYGILAQVTQTLKIESTPIINSRYFGEDQSVRKDLALEHTDNKSFLKNGDTVLKTLQELEKLSVSKENQQRAKLFQKFVTGLRALENDTLSSILPRLMEISGIITPQALPQCGTPECFSAILQLLRSRALPPSSADVVVYTMGLLPSPSAKRVQDVLSMAQYQQSRATMYALSHTTKNFFQAQKTVTQEVKDVADFMAFMLGNDCSGDKEETYLTLKAIGNMGKAMEDANPKLKSTILKCISTSTSLSVQQAAIQAFRQMSLTPEVRSTLLQAYQDSSAPVQKRLAAYLMLMKGPSSSDLSKITKSLMKENDQVKYFVASHFGNILHSEDPDIQELKSQLTEVLKGGQIPSAMDFRRFSGNYQASKAVSIPGMENPVAAKLEGNIIFDSNNYLPKEAMLETTLNVLGQSIDMFEFGLDGNGFEPTVEALFGQEGFFPSTAMKALYWVNGKVPEKVSDLLYKWFGVPKGKQLNQGLMKEIMHNAQKLMKKLKSQESPEAKAYLRILGTELGYMKLSDFKVMGDMVMNNLQVLQMLPGQIIKAMSKGIDSELSAQYIFMDNEFGLPTGSGFQLQFSLSGTVASTATARLKVDSSNMQGEVIVKPSMSLEFVTHMGINIPKFTTNGVEMNSNIYHESGVDVRVAVNDGQFKLSIPAPTGPTKLFSVSNKLHLVSTTKTEVVPPLIENREAKTSCTPFFTGLKYCTIIEYSNASSVDAAPYYPLTGETKFELELQPTGKVQEYSATVKYALQKEGQDMVDTVRLAVQAEGAEGTEATVTLKYNRKKMTVSSNVAIPSFDVDFGVQLGPDESYRERNSYTIRISATNKNVPEVTLLGRARYDEKLEGVLQGMFSIPRLNIEAKTETSVQFKNKKVIVKMDASGNIPQSVASQKVIFTYDSDNVKIEWNSDASTNLKKILANAQKLLKNVELPDLSSYPEKLKKHADDILEQKVPQTDMTLRYILSKSIVATHEWLQMKGGDIPYAPTLKTILTEIQDLNLDKIGFPSISFPEKLFLKSDGSAKYKFNTEKLVVEVSVPLGGKTSQDLKLPNVVRTPPLFLPDLGINIPTKEYKIPSFTIPDYYRLHLPLLGVVEFSSRMKSNYYDWSASFRGGNFTETSTNFTADYSVQADSAVDLLSYKLQGTARATYNRLKDFVLSYDGSLHHSFLDANLRYNYFIDLEKYASSKSSSSLDVTSPLGVKLILSSYEESENTEALQLIAQQKYDGELHVASFYIKETHTISYTFDFASSEGTGQSDFKLESSLFQATNIITGTYTKRKLSIMSNTNLQNGGLVNIAKITYQDGQLTLTSNLNGKYQSLSGSNKVELKVTADSGRIRSEYQVDYYNYRCYTLVAGSLNSFGLELNADATVNDEKSRLAHKSTLQISDKGLTTSAFTNMNNSPLILENRLDATIAASGASMKVTATGRMQEHNAQFSLDGKVGASEISLGSVYQSNILDMSSSNSLNFKINKENLEFSNTLMGEYKEMKIEHKNDLKIVSSSLLFLSQMESSLSKLRSYNQKFEFNMQPYTLLAKLNNNFKYDEIDVSSTGQLQIEPFKLQLNGDMKGAYIKDEIKYTYKINYADLKATVLTNTHGKIQSATLSDRTELEIAGLSAKFNSETSCRSKSLQFNNAVRTLLVPFTATVEVNTNGDGLLNVLGSHTGQIYSKFLLKAEPLAFTFSHDYRGSSNHILENGISINTLIEDKVNVLFTPPKQSSSWQLKTDLNKISYSHDVNAYNDEEKIGVELSGKVMADLSVLDSTVHFPLGTSVSFNLIDAMNLRNFVEEPQTFGISGFLKYDKNKDVHTINFAFLEDLPVYFEQFKDIIVSTLESMQYYLKSINIDKYIRTYKATLDELAQKMSDKMNNLDLETSINTMKQNLITFCKQYKIKTQDFERVLEKATLFYVGFLEYLTQLQEYLKDICNQYELGQVVERLIQQIVDKLKELDQRYEVTQIVIRTIDRLQDNIQQYNLKSIKESASAFLQNMNAKYKIITQLQEMLEKLKTEIQKLDIQKIADNLKSHIQCINIEDYIKKLKSYLPSEKITEIIERLKAILLSLIEEYEVSEKINILCVKIKEIIVQYEVDKQAHVLMDKTLQLINQYKVKEKIKTALASLKNIDVKPCINKMNKNVGDAIKQLKSYDYKQFIDQLNNLIDRIVQKLKSFDYDTFVDETNNKIQELTEKLNGQIKALEPLKVHVENSLRAAMEYAKTFKDTKLSAIIEWFKDLLTTTALNDLKNSMQENLEELRTRIYSINIEQELQMYLEQTSQVYRGVINYITEQWNKIANMIADLADLYHVRDWATSIQTFVEEGFVVPEIKTNMIHIHAFEISLRALRKAEFVTPEFMVPLTDLRIRSCHINLMKLKDMKIPTKFVTPEFTILDTFTVPSFTLDLNEIKLMIVRAIDSIQYTEFKWPTTGQYLKDLTLKDVHFPDISLPELNFPQLRIPEITIPKVNLEEFQLPEIQIPVFKLPRIPHTTTVPTFGKLSGSFNVESPIYTLTTSLTIENSTTSQKNPEFVASVTAQAKSNIEFLAFSLDTNAHLSAPRMTQLVMRENIKFKHESLSMNHNSEVTFSRSSVKGKAETEAMANFKVYSGKAENKITAQLQKGISITIETNYNHDLGIPGFVDSSQVNVRNAISTALEAESVSSTVTTSGTGKLNTPWFSDEGTHNSKILFTTRGSFSTLSLTATTSSKHLKMEQTINLDSGSLNYIALNLKAETQSPYIGKSDLNINGKGQLNNLKTELTVNHNAILSGRASGTITNSLNFLAEPFQITCSTNNKGTVKISFPKKLTGKIEFQNNYDLTLNPDIQQMSWQASGRFNQYKYSHNISVGNNEETIGGYLGMNGEANLDFLTIPISIHEISIPYTLLVTPKVTEFSLWERTGLKELLRTTRQSFDLSFKIQYKKNKDMHSFSLPLESVYKVINHNIKSLNNNFEKGRDQVLSFLVESYNKAKTQFDTFNIETSVNKLPRTIKIPGFTVPILKIEVSPLVAELPAFSYVIPKEVITPSFTFPLVGFSVPSYTLVLPSLELPVIDVPNSLQKLSLPKFKLPKVQNTITVPAMGNITCELIFKSTVITLNSNAGIYNQSDINARFGVSSSSVFDVLNFKLDGTTSLTRKRGLKLATALSMTHKNLQGNHDSTISLTKNNMDASVTTNLKVTSPVFNLNFNQDLKGNPESKHTVSSKITIDYDFTVKQYDTEGNGKVDHTLTLDGLTSYFSLETSTNGFITGTLLTSNKFAGTVNNEASTYLSSDGLRSSVKLEGKSMLERNKDKIFNVEMKDSLAFQASTRRIFAVWDYTGSNDINISPALKTKGSQEAKATFELIPWSLILNTNAQISQTSNFMKDVYTHQKVLLNIDTEMQKFVWNSEGGILSVILSHDVLLANDKEKIQCDISGSLQGHADFLELIVLPIYDKSLWNILKFDLTTSVDQLQYLNASTSLSYTKNKDGYFFLLPVINLADGFTINIPELTLKIKIPSVISTPEFRVPLTTLVVPSYSIDFNKIKIPTKISTLPFESTLTSLPKLRFPKIDVGTKYLVVKEYKLPYFQVIIPEFKITISKFTIPKTLTLGSYTLDLDNLVNQIANFDLPTISIPEQKIEIPSLKISLPAGFSIPAFGTFSGNVKLFTPIYNTTWTTSLKNATNSLVFLVDATCSSTLQFLEYDIEAITTTTYLGNTFSLGEKTSISHRDFSVEGQQHFSLTDSGVTRHNLTLDITSPTFTQVNIRHVQNNGRIASSVSSPAAGFLGLLLEKKDSTLLTGKVYKRTTVSPEKDIPLLEGQISLKTPEKLSIKAKWNGDAALDMVEGLKEKLPKMADSVYNCINKYHHEHFGMEIRTASLKLKDTMQKNIDKTYRVTTKKIDEVEKQLRTAAKDATEKYVLIKDQTRKLYKRAADEIAQVDLQKMSADFFETAVYFVRKYQKKMKDLIDAAINFLKVTKFHLPGFDEKYTGEELYVMATRKIAFTVDQFIQNVKDFLQQYSDALISIIKDVEFTFPSMEKPISGKDILDLVKVQLRNIQQKAQEIMTTLQDSSLEEVLQKLKTCVQQCFQRAEEKLNSMKTEGFETLKTQAQMMYNKATNSLPMEKLEKVKESIKEFVSFLYEISNNKLKKLLSLLEEISNNIVNLHEEYVGNYEHEWAVKFRDFEKRTVNLLIELIDYVKETGSDFIEQTTKFAVDILIDYEGKGKQRINELSMKAQTKIQEWSVAVKNSAAKWKEQAKLKLHETYHQLSSLYEKIIIEAKNLIDQSVEKYNEFILFIMQLLEELQTSNSLQLHIEVHQGELKIDL